MNQYEEENLNLRSYVNVLRRQSHIIAALGLAALLIAGAILLRGLGAASSYQAEARVLVNPLPTTDPGGIPPGVNLTTESQVAASPDVAERVAEILGSETSGSGLADGLTVAPVPESEILVFTYQTSTPSSTVERANAFAEAYVGYRNKLATEELDDIRGAFQQRIDRLETEITRFTERIAAARGRGERNLAESLDATRSALLVQVLELQGELASIEAQARGPDAAAVMESAMEAVELSPSPSLRVLIGLVLLALLVGIGLAFLKENFEDRVRTTRAAEQELGLDVLGMVSLGNGRRWFQPVSDPHSTSALQVARLGDTLQVMLKRTGTKSVLLTSPRALDDSVEILRQGLIQSQGQQDPASSGAEPHDRAHQTSSDSASETGALVVLGEPGLLTNGAALEAATSADRVLIAIDANKTTRTDVQDTIRQLKRVEAAILGCILLNGDRH